MGQIHYKLPDQVHNQLKGKVYSEGMTMHDFLDKAVEDYLGINIDRTKKKNEDEDVSDND